MRDVRAWSTEGTKAPTTSGLIELSSGRDEAGSEMASRVVAEPRTGTRREGERKRKATHIVVSAFGALVALAGIEHGVGAFLQGSVAPSSPVFESWPDTAGFAVVSGEPAMTVIPNLAISGVVAIVVALAVGIWAVWYIERPTGGLVLIGLSGLLLLVGGGFGPPLIGLIAGFAATRIGRSGSDSPGPVRAALARVWPWLLGAALVGYLSLVPGMVLVSRFTGFDEPAVVAGLTGFSFTTLILALVAARAHDRLGER